MNQNPLHKSTPPPLPSENHYTMLDWFKKGLRNYANFSGRARRKEYWYFALTQAIISLIAMALDAVLFDSEFGLLYGIVALALFVPSLALTIRRLHDTNRSGWWFLISFVPLIGGIVLFVFLISDTKPETNQWGPPPK